MAGHFARSGGVSAACGLRFASDGFFSAIYLDRPVADAVSHATGAVVPASRIIEVTSLASSTRSGGLALVSDVIGAAVATGIHFGCFTATARLAKALARSGLDLLRVADARADRIPNPQDWGSYYTQAPAVYVVDCRPDRTKPQERSMA